MMQVGNEWSWIINLLFIVFFFIMYMYGTRIQAYVWTRQVETAVNQLESLATQSKQIAIRNLKDIAVKEQDIKSTVEDFLEFFIIQPVNLDPAGVLSRLEHLLDVRTHRYEKEISRIAPKADPEKAANSESVLSGAMALNHIFRVVRHFMILGKKTKNIYYIMQVQMQLPEIMRMAKAYFEAVRAFADGKPIGDGMGPLAIAHLARELNAGKSEEIAHHTISQPSKFEGRNVFFVRAKGHGSHVGKPGEAIKLLVDKNKGKISRIITVDAGIRLEGEDSGHVIEGVGAAIGDPGPEKFKMEDSGVRYDIPIDAILIKESLEDALSPMKKVLVDAVPKVIERIKNAILLRTKKGDTIIIAGIGNSIGIA
ncbi:MAG: DUF1512 family protein [Promethearchaeota archaeon]